MYVHNRGMLSHLDTHNTTRSEDLIRSLISVVKMETFVCICFLRHARNMRSNAPRVSVFDVSIRHKNQRGGVNLSILSQRILKLLKKCNMHALQPSKNLKKINKQHIEIFPEQKLYA